MAEMISGLNLLLRERDQLRAALQRLHDWALAQEGDCMFSGDHPIAQAAAALTGVPVSQAQSLSPGQQQAMERQKRLVATLPQTREQAAMLTPCLATGQSADPTPRLCGHCGKVAAPGGTCAYGVRVPDAPQPYQRAVLDALANPEPVQVRIAGVAPTVQPYGPMADAFARREPLLDPRGKYHGTAGVLGTPETKEIDRA